jgi:hypothetical protein
MLLHYLKLKPVFYSRKSFYYLLNHLKMKNKLKVLASIIAVSALTIFSSTAQRSSDYAYQNSNSGYNSGYNSRDSRYQNNKNNNCDAHSSNRSYYTASPELQRLYQIEDALRRRIDANIALGDRREARRDSEKLEDVQRRILREENRYASINRGYSNNNRDRHPDFDHNGRRH